MREQALPVREISRQALYRLPFYLSYLKKAEADGVLYISAPKVAADLDLNEVQVRKDIAKVSSCAGKPKIGYETAKLIKDLEKFLGYDNTTDAVVVGVGSLGSSLLHYDGFSECGFRIVAGFDAVNFDEEPFKKGKARLSHAKARRALRKTQGAYGGYSCAGGQCSGCLRRACQKRNTCNS